jgi:predicted nucleic acid-binding protein
VGPRVSEDAPLLLDNSAWARLAVPGIPSEPRELVARWIRERRLVVCLPFLLEVGYSARNAADHRTLVERLVALPYAHLDRETEQLAVDAQGELARRAHHCLPPVDLLIAALAHRRRCGVLHCDRHYDLIARETGLTFESLWLPGTT